MDIIDKSKIKVITTLKEKRFYKELEERNSSLLDEIASLKKQLAGRETELEENRHLLDYFWFVQPGHYYSPLINPSAVNGELLDLNDIDALKTKSLPGIEANKTAQLELFGKLLGHVGEVPNYTNKPKDLRYKFANDQFGTSDGSFLFMMLRHLKPKQIIEVGSGWSSALMLDINQLYPQSAARLTFVEPYPERLYSTFKSGDKKHCKVIVKAVQEVPLTEFKALKKGDVLFIDNSHVSKTGSDVNHLFLEVLPRLNKGVVIHVHDIFYPFEYPKQWVVEEKRNWNEAYTLRALLVGSSMFEIMFWPSYLKALNPRMFKKLPPLDHGGSIWLRKL